MRVLPKVGWLLSYSYRWARQHSFGADQGAKIRPCALIAAARRKRCRIVALAVPLTHRPRIDPKTAIEIPAVTKLRLDLDAQRSWIICNKANIFTWPGFDLHTVKGRTPPSIWYGPLPCDNW